MSKKECDICGEDLSGYGPLGSEKCVKCGLEPLCEKCHDIHKEENKTRPECKRAVR